MVDAVKREKDSADPTPEMIEAGLEELWGYLDPADGEEHLKEGVKEVYLAMERARRESGTRPLVEELKRENKVLLATIHELEERIETLLLEREDFRE